MAWLLAAFRLRELSSSFLSASRHLWHLSRVYSSLHRCSKCFERSCQVSFGQPQELWRFPLLRIEVVSLSRCPCAYCGSALCMGQSQCLDLIDACWHEATGARTAGLPLKRFVNHPREVVHDALEGAYFRSRFCDV